MDVFSSNPYGKIFKIVLEEETPEAIIDLLKILIITAFKTFNSAAIFTTI